MRLLITGGAGFIGANFAHRALAAGDEITVYDALTYAGNPDNLADLDGCGRYRFMHADVRDVDALVVAMADCEAVVHFAAESHVDRSIDGPGTFIETNVMGTFQMLEAARAHWVQKGRPESFRFHHISTDEVFGSLPADPEVQFTEDTPYDPRSPYSASKAGSDHLVRAWTRTYGLPCLVTNCSNNYGPYQHKEKLIPTIIRKAISGEPIPIYGDGKNVILINAPVVGPIIYAFLDSFFNDGFNLMKTIAILSSTGIIYFSYFNMF